MADLERFVTAQQPVWDQARGELAAGRKTTHWMWFVLPQLRGLGSSPMAREYAIADLDQARAYLDHPVLGPRLREAAELAADAPASSVEELMGGVDALKLRSSMTLFHLADPAEPAFARALDRWWGGALDQRTVELLGLGGVTQADEGHDVRTR